MDDPFLLPEILKNNLNFIGKHYFLPNLAALELARFQVENVQDDPLPENPKSRIINPSLTVLTVHWQNLIGVLHSPDLIPEPGDDNILIFRQPDTGDTQILSASGYDLLALKIVSEEIDSHQAAQEGGVTVGVIDDILYSAVVRGLLIAPKSRIVRSDDFHRGQITDPSWFTSPTFTLQWHVTQVCDLHCRHCYDRSDRVPMQLDQGIRVLDDLYDFCQSHNVFTQVTFTGGNPLLYPHFTELYQAAAERGFMTAILGNPMPRQRIEELLTIQMPEFYQVSLEGLQPQNDYIRGDSHFERIFAFLDLLKELKIYSMVMLTLTRQNMADVLPLAELLRDRVDLFTFNRLAMVGEGAALASAPTEQYPAFLKSYLMAAEKNPCMSLKDNFFNVLRHQNHQPYGGGCAGFGCGAAFNFVSLLPDGEVHACRKLPSHIGNMYERSLDEIYHDAPAKRYRAGSSACSDCGIRPVCGGCMAVNYGFNRDIFTEIDPYCFMNSDD